MSRSSLKAKSSPDLDMFKIVHLVSKFLLSQENKGQFRLEISKDPVLIKIHDYRHYGWPNEKNISACCKPFYPLRDSIYVEAGIIFVEDKLIVP